MLTKALIRRPSWQTLKDTFKFFPSWFNHLKKGRSSVSDCMPWLSFGAIDFIKRVIKRDMCVFEYGSGGSTLFWAANVNKVVSVEHEKEWYKKIAEEFQRKSVNTVEYILSEAENEPEFMNKNFANPHDYISADSSFKGKNFKKYVQQIDHFPDHYFDIVVVDGRARPSCILHSLKKLKKGGYLIVDNSERDYYLSTLTFNKSEWNIWKFYGPVPYIYHFSETTIFQKKGINKANSGV